MSDKLIRAIAKDGMIRIFATETTELVDEASKYMIVHLQLLLP